MKKLLILITLLIPINIYALNVTSKRAILYDMDFNRILYEKNIDEKSLIASTTKIMTAIIAIESGKLNEIVVVGDEILSMYGSNIYLSLKEEISIKDLVYGLMLRSGNDASVVIAENVCNSIDEFVSLMNIKAIELNMINTYFCNPNGLDEKCENISTARDMALLMSYAMKNDTFKEITGTKRYKTSSNLKSYDWYNKNKLLSLYKYTTGGKTGFTEKANRTLVTSASKNDINLVCVTLDDSNDFNTHKSLYEYGFNNYKKYLILNKNNFKLDNDYYKNLYIKENVYYLLTKDELELINIKYILNKTSNDIVGTANIYLDNKLIKSIDIYQTKKKTSFIEKILNLFR